MTVATARPAELDELRGRIDRIDEAIVGLLGERVAVVAEIARAKGGQGAGLALRPAREAQVVRRLLRAGAAAGLPAETLVRVWRELFAAATRAQSPFSVLVHAPEGRPALWDLARDHFGALTPVRRAVGPEEAVRAAAAADRVVAVVPVPEGDERWWGSLAGDRGWPRVVARLPFLALPGYPEGLAALAVARLAPEPSGDDLSLLVLETDGDTGAAALRDLAAALGPRVLASRRDPAGEGWRHLVEVDGFLADAGAATRALAPLLGGRLLRAVAAGCYARPLAAADLAPRAADTR